MAKPVIVVLPTLIMPSTSSEVGVIAELTVELPTVIEDVVILTLAPTLMAVDTLTVAGNLAVSRVPEDMLVALAAQLVALVYALLGTCLTHIIGKPLSEILYKGEKKEADFRSTHCELSF